MGLCEEETGGRRGHKVIMDVYLECMRTTGKRMGDVPCVIAYTH